VIVNISEDKISITGKLRGWNFLTGFIPMKLTGAYIYNMVASIVLIPFLVYMARYWSVLLVTFIFIFAWVIGNILFYQIQLESMKTRIYDWLKKLAITEFF